MKPSGAHRILVERDELLSWLALPGMAEEQAAPAVVRFSPDDGVTALLLDAPTGWPTELGDRGEMVVHGVTVDGGHPFTILDARVNQLALGDHARRLRAMTLALGAHFDLQMTWSSASYGTAHLHEWTGDTGLRITDWDFDERGQTRRFAHEWTPPPAHVIERPEARLTIGPVMQTQASYSAEQRVVTSTRLGVRPAAPLTVDQFERAYARPLLAFCTLAADRPDAIIHEAVSDKQRQERAVILRAGRTVDTREWQPDNRFLFRAEQIDDVARVYGRWMELWDEASVEIATFVDAISEGNTFSRARLLAGVAALEAYWRTRLQFDERGAKRKGTSLVEKLKMLRAYASVDAALLGVTNANLKLIAAARNLYAHLDQTVVSLSDEEIDDHLMGNCRRAGALLQACLLRDLEIPPAKAQAMFEEHLSNWPLN
jgi:hypothetical protein